MKREDCESGIIGLYSLPKVEAAFERADKFIPERWYSKPEMIKNKHAFAPFGTGERTKPPLTPTPFQRHRKG